MSTSGISFIHFGHQKLSETSSAASSSSQSPEIHDAFQRLAASSSTNPNSLITRVTTLDEPYQSLLSDLTEQQRSEIEKALDQITDSEVNAWVASFKTNESLNINPHIALKALKKREITSLQFSTAITHWLIVKTAPVSIETVKLFDSNGAILKNAKDLIKETLLCWVTKSNSDLSENQLDRFFEKMRKSPASEQQFLIILDESPDFIVSDGSLEMQRQIDNDIFSGKRTISHQIASSGKFNIFSRCTEKDRKMRMIPSFGMMQTYLKVKYPDTYVQIKPLLGLASFKTIVEGGKTQTRPMSLPFPSIDLPEEADSFSAKNPWDFIYHDFYHAKLASGIPQKYQRGFILVSEIVEQLKTNSEFANNNDFFDHYIGHIVDMECPVFSEANDLNKKFWEILDSQCNDALMSVDLTHCKALAQSHQDGTMNAKLLAAKHEIGELLFKKNFMHVLADEIANRQSDFCELGINFEPIKSISRSLQISVNIKKMIDRTSPETYLKIAISLRLHEKLFPEDFELCRNELKTQCVIS